MTALGSMAMPQMAVIISALAWPSIRIAVCSNWDWDLDRHLGETGVLPLVDARVSSAWVGARKPHPRIFEATLAEVGANLVASAGGSRRPRLSSRSESIRPDPSPARRTPQAESR